MPEGVGSILVAFMSSSCVALRALIVSLLLVAPVQAQKPGERIPLPAKPVEKIREGVFRIGSIEIDTIKRELSVPATINSGVTTLEFVANVPNGAKSYESALTVKADAYEFNSAALLLGVDPARSRVPRYHFDPATPAGDALDLYVSWTAAGGSTKRVRIEELLFDERTKAPLSEGPWVYTGSSFVNGGYMAALDGVLIGFVHSPSPIIENPRNGAVSAYGSVVLNTHLGLAGGTPVTLTVKAVPAKKGPRP